MFPNETLGQEAGVGEVVESWDGGQLRFPPE